MECPAWSLSETSFSLLSLSLFSFLVPAQSSLDRLTTIRVRRVSALPDLYFLYLAWIRLYFVPFWADGIQSRVELSIRCEKDTIGKENLEKIERVSLNRVVCYCSAIKRLRCGRFDMSDLTRLRNPLKLHQLNYR